MPTYKTPGVYVEEISLRPPSVAEVATAVPAFFVKVGLGTTMAAQDILAGRMIVEIGMAVVRPAMLGGPHLKVTIDGSSSYAGKPRPYYSSFPLRRESRNVTSEVVSKPCRWFLSHTVRVFLRHNDGPGFFSVDLDGQWIFKFDVMQVVRLFRGWQGLQPLPVDKILTIFGGG